MTDHIKTEAPVAAEATPQLPTDSTVDEQITHPLQETLSREGMDSQEHFMDAAEEPQTDIQGNENSTTSLAPTLEQSTTAQTSEAIGPDLPTPTIEIQPQVGTHIQFILLLASAGTRHPFQLSEKYLSKRNVSATGPDGNFDPSVISVYNLKELIFREWRDGKIKSDVVGGALLIISTRLGDQAFLTVSDSPHLLWPDACRQH